VKTKFFELSDFHDLSAFVCVLYTRCIKLMQKGEVMSVSTFCFLKSMTDYSAD